jgi:adenylosuccinate synthase
MKLVVIGAQWGDEGKGKVVDYLANEARIIVRFSGGANAGHTIVVGGERYALHLVPSGILYPGTIVVLGAGMVIDPEALFAEIAMLEERGVTTEGRILVSDRAHIVLPSYINTDKERDALRKTPIGTTGRGIGIAYAMKAERDGIRVADLAWREKLETLGKGDQDFLARHAERLSALSVNLASYIYQHKTERILFEGAQGSLLDIDMGTYPFVSSGMSSASGAAVGGCLGPRGLDRVMGVFKAYSTRVGNGPFPSEFDSNDRFEDELCRFVRETGREYGVTTGRPRRCGSLDLVALRYACLANSIDCLAMTHLDVYDTLSEVKACTAYRVKGVKTKDFPASIAALESAEPVFRTFTGWRQSLAALRSYDAFPQHAKDYISYIEDYCETPVSIVSVGYERDKTIIRSDPWS